MTAVEADAARTAGDAVPDHSRFPALDGLRAVAVLAVIGTHSGFWTGRYDRGIGGGLLARLDSGVAVFFVLSGLLLVRPWLQQATGARPVSLRVYFWRRALRILPIYWITVAIALLFVPDNRNAGPGDWLRHAALLQIYRTGWLRQGLTQTWSLCTEAAFYVVLPLLGIVAVRWNRRRGWHAAPLLAAFAGLVAVTVAWLAVANDASWAQGRPFEYWLPSYLSWFATGMGLAVVVHDVDLHPGRWARLRAAASAPGACWTVALALLVLVSTPIGGPRGLGQSDAGTAIARNLVYAAMAALVALPCVLGRSRLNEAVLANRPMRYLGRISYGMFLLHLLVLEAVMHVLGNRTFTGSAGQVFLFTTGGTIAVAALAYRVVEQPAMRLRRLVRPGGHRARTSPPARTR